MFPPPLIPNWDAFLENLHMFCVCHLSLLPIRPIHIQPCNLCYRWLAALLCPPIPLAAVARISLAQHAVRMGTHGAFGRTS
jgi:hypothetical protein